MEEVSPVGMVVAHGGGQNWVMLSCGGVIEPEF